MILTCPSCRTRYQADSARFAPPGRNVRCAKCSKVWFQAAPELDLEIEPEPALAPPPLGPAQQAQAGHQGTGGLNLGVRPRAADMLAGMLAIKRWSWGELLAQFSGWAALVLLVAVLLWGLVQYRQTIANVWPQSATLYAALGMPVNVRGIALTEVAYQQEFEDGQPVLSVTGKVVNISDRELPVPMIRVVLLDEARLELYHWTFDAGISTLQPGTERSFVTRLSSPPPEARNLNVRFAESGETE